MQDFDQLFIQTVKHLLNGTYMLVSKQQRLSTEWIKFLSKQKIGLCGQTQIARPCNGGRSTLKRKGKCFITKIKTSQLTNCKILKLYKACGQ